MIPYNSLPIAFLFAVPLLIGGCESESSPGSGAEPAVLTDAVNAAGPTSSGPMMSTPFIFPGVLSPTTYSSAEVNIPDTAVVIGVAEGDDAKAYLCLAMSAMTSHVVNDLIGNQPISVTYCDRTDCARVLSGKEEGVPPNVELGGFTNNQMALRVNKTMYAQTSEMIPLKDREFQKTTWAKWKEEHPTTTIYLGDQDSKFLIK